MNRSCAAGLATLFFLGAAGAGLQAAEPSSGGAKASAPESGLERYVGRDATEFLNDPLVQKGVARLLGGRKDSFTGKKRVQPTARTLGELLGIPEKVEKIDGGYLFAYGCREHSCEEKAFLAADRDAKRTFVGIFDFYDKGRYTSEGDDVISAGILHIFGKVASLADLPKPVAERIERWKTETVTPLHGKFGDRIKEVRLNR